MAESADLQQVSELSLDELVGCHECDLLLRKPQLAAGDRAECPRCGFVLYSHNHQVIRRSFALVLAALLLYVPANFLPIMQINVLGQTSEDTIWSGVMSLYDSGGLLKSIALVVFLCSMVIPLVKLLIQFIVLLTIRLDFARSFGLLLYRMYHHFKEWGMLEVYLMGILVSIVKLIDIASPTLDFGLACFVALLLVQVWLEVTMEPHQIWEALSGGEAYASH
ncbi:MAG: paraquat-inducible protein A [Pseudomonadaceae bacterium]|nr:paraquat-inducible protein A [Pseudomonadaceae bacterium]